MQRLAPSYLSLYSFFFLHLLHCMFCYLFFDPFFQNPVSYKIICRELCCTAMILQILVKKQEEYEQIKENLNKTLLPKTKLHTSIVLPNSSKDFCLHYSWFHYFIFFCQTVRHNITKIYRDMLCIEWALVFFFFCMLKLPKNCLYMTVGIFYRVLFYFYIILQAVENFF